MTPSLQPAHQVQFVEHSAIDYKPPDYDEYYCPVCGRRIWIRYTPFERLVVDEGDETAMHSGGRGLKVKLEQ